MLINIGNCKHKHVAVKIRDPFCHLRKQFWCPPYHFRIQVTRDVELLRPCFLNRFETRRTAGQTGPNHYNTLYESKAQWRRNNMGAWSRGVPLCVASQLLCLSPSKLVASSRATHGRTIPWPLSKSWLSIFEAFLGLFRPYYNYPPDHSSSVIELIWLTDTNKSSELPSTYLACYQHHALIAYILSAPSFSDRF